MQSVTKFAVASFAMLLLGSSAALAQPYGYNGPMIGQNGPTSGYCGPTNVLAHNWITDPATGQAITEPQYQSRYPWTNISTWTYNCASGLWMDNTAQPGAGYVAPQAQYYGGDRGHEADRDRSRDRDRERAYDRDREQNYDRDRDREDRDHD